MLREILQEIEELGNSEVVVPHGEELIYYVEFYLGKDILALLQTKYIHGFMEPKNEEALLQLYEVCFGSDLPSAKEFTRDLVSGKFGKVTDIRLTHKSFAGDTFHSEKIIKRMTPAFDRLGS